MLNQTVYPDIYKRDFTQGSGSNVQNFSIPFSYSVREGLERNLHDTENPFDNSNVYTVYNNDVENTIGEYTLLQWPERDNFRHFKTEVKKTTGKKNLRMFFGCQQGQNPLCYRDAFTWGDLGRYQNAYKDTELTMTSSLVSCNYDGLDIFTRNNRQFSLIASAGGAGSIFTLNPITKINVNALILLPYFHINTRRIYGYNTDTGMYTNISSVTDVSRSWADIKPADNTPQGQYYDDDLYNYGYKVTYGEDEIILQWIDCVRIIPYYGITDTVYDSDTDTFSGNTKGNRINFSNLQNALNDSPVLSYNQYERNLRYQIFTILAEELNEDTGNIIYSSLPGVIFSDLNSNVASDFGILAPITINSSGAQITQASGFTPLTQYYGNRIYSGIYGKTEISGNPTVIVPCVTATTDYTALAAGFTYDDNGHFISVQSPTRYSITANGYFSIKKLWSTIAAMGLFVADSEQCARATNLSDFNCNRLYIGEMLPNGETTGNMLQGQNIANSLQPTIDDIINDTPVTPVNPLEPPEPVEPDLPEETGDRIENQFSRTIGVSSNFITTYIMNDAQISELGRILWTSWTDDTVTMDMVQNFYGLLQETTGSWDISSVMNFIVSCKIFPFSLPTLLSTTPTRNLYIGTGKFAIQCSTGVDFFIAGSPTAVLTAGSVIVPKLYNDFRDYENTNITVYLPYCGNLELNPADVVGKQLNCTYVIDLFSGACTAYLYTSDDDGILYNVAIQKGKCGFNVPITATNAGQIATMLTVDGLKDAQGIAGMLGTAINSGLGILNLGAGSRQPTTGQYASALQGGINGFVQQGFGLEIMQQERMGRSGISCRSMPGGSNFGDFMCPSTAYIQIRRAMYSMPSEYASTVGYTTHAKRYGKVSQFNGFIQCVNVDVSGLSITEEEKNEIKYLLESGIYVN